jgi:type VI secretion system secreted protein VgrG
MADEIKQAGRFMSLATPLGPDVLCVESANISERLSKPFVMQFDMLAESSKASSIDYQKLLGQNVTLTVELPGKKKRYFCGMVSRFSASGQDERFAYYRMEVVPWLWLLTLTTDCKVFQNKTVPDIIEDVFKEWQGKYSQVVHFEKKLSGSFTKLDYCVQYRETDFNFVSRLMEEEGIFFYFKHEDGKHTLVLSNDVSSLPACPNLEQARFLPESGMGEWEDGIASLEDRRSIVPGKTTLADYHFQMSNKSLRKPATSSVKVASNDNLEIFDYPGEYAQRFTKPDERLGDVENHGAEIAQRRMEEHGSGHLLISGTSSCRAFSPGFYFSMIGAEGKPKKVPGTEGKYVVTSVKHSLQQSPDYISGGSTNHPYRNTFTCIQKEVPFRPARSTPRPVVQGMQTAVVVGLKGEEIDCDKYGRVKVQFHWDREGKKDENSSCWVRVASPLAGNRMGLIHIPRMGQEVVVAFLEGDPDHPLIVGSVYNYDNMPPFELPDNKTQCGLMTMSTKDGKPQENFNGIRIEDKKDHERFDVHAERDFRRVTKNNEEIYVGTDTKDPGNQKVEIFNNQEVTIGTPQSQDGSQKLTVQKDRSATLEMGNDALTIKMGNQTTKLNLGKSETEALQSIELKVGQSSVKVDQTGVTISGMMIQINGQVMTQVKGAMTTVQGSGMLQLSGGIMMLG